MITCSMCGAAPAEIPTAWSWNAITKQHEQMDLLPRGWRVHFEGGFKKHRCPDCAGVFDFGERAM